MNRGHAELRGGGGPTTVLPPLAKRPLVYGVSRPRRARMGSISDGLFLSNDGALLNPSCFISRISGSPGEVGQLRSEGHTEHLRGQVLFSVSPNGHLKECIWWLPWVICVSKSKGSALRGSLLLSRAPVCMGKSHRNASFHRAGGLHWRGLYHCMGCGLWGSLWSEAPFQGGHNVGNPDKRGQKKPRSGDTTGRPVAESFIVGGGGNCPGQKLLFNLIRNIVSMAGPRGSQEPRLCSRSRPLSGLAAQPARGTRSMMSCKARSPYSLLGCQ